MGIYNPFQKLAVGPRQQKKSAVGRPPGRPANGQIFNRCATGRPPCRPGLDTESNSFLPVDRPVDRGHFQRAKLSGGRPGRSTGLPAKRLCARLCTSADRTSRPTSAVVNRPVDRQNSQVKLFRD